MTFSLELSDDVIEVRDWVHQFASEVIRPAAAEWLRLRLHPARRLAAGGWRWINSRRRPFPKKASAGFPKLGNGEGK